MTIKKFANLRLVLLTTALLIPAASFAQAEQWTYTDWDNDGNLELSENEFATGFADTRAFETRVTDEAVQQTYDQIAEQTAEELPPLEDVRLQIEQQLQQQAVEGVPQVLAADVEIVFYGPDGEPMEAGSDERS